MADPLRLILDEATRRAGPGNPGRALGPDPGRVTDTGESHLHI